MDYKMSEFESEPNLANNDDNNPEIMAVSREAENEISDVEADQKAGEISDSQAQEKIKEILRRTRAAEQNIKGNL